MRTLACLAVLSLAVFPIAITQELPVEPGQRVRVTVPSLGIDQLVATVDRLDAGMLTVTAGSTLQCPLADVTRLEVHRGTRRRILEGALGLGAFGALLGFVAGSSCNESGIEYSQSGWASDLCFERAQAVPAAAVGFALLGAGIGTLSRTDRWEEVPLDPVRVRPIVRRDALGVGVRVGF